MRGKRAKQLRKIAYQLCEQRGLTKDEMEIIHAGRRSFVTAQGERRFVPSFTHVWKPGPRRAYRLMKNLYTRGQLPWS